MTTAERPHVHHFRFDAPDGTSHMPTVTGVCIGCGEQRTHLTAGPLMEDETKRRHRSYDGGKAEPELQVLGDLPRRNRKRVAS